MEPPGGPAGSMVDIPGHGSDVAASSTVTASLDRRSDTSTPTPERGVGSSNDDGRSGLVVVPRCEDADAMAYDNQTRLNDLPQRHTFDGVADKDGEVPCSSPQP